VRVPISGSRIGPPAKVVIAVPSRSLLSQKIHAARMPKRPASPARSRWACRGRGGRVAGDQPRVEIDAAAGGAAT
jgi:hypothetical protein